MLRRLAVLGLTVAACSGAGAGAGAGTGAGTGTGAAAGTGTEAAVEEPVEAFELPGTYTNKHTIMVVCDKPDWCEQEVDDRITIREAGEAIEVDIELVQANAHTCTFAGKLEPAGDHEWVFATRDGDDGHPCVLELTAGPSELELRSEGCRYYCGARAYLEASFPYN